MLFDPMAYRPSPSLLPVSTTTNASYLAPPDLSHIHRMQTDHQMRSMQVQMDMQAATGDETTRRPTLPAHITQEFERLMKKITTLEAQRSELASKVSTLQAENETLKKANAKLKATSPSAGGAAADTAVAGGAAADTAAAGGAPFATLTSWRQWTKASGNTGVSYR